MSDETRERGSGSGPDPAALPALPAIDTAFPPAPETLVDGVPPSWPVGSFASPPVPALVRGSGDDRKLQACAEVYLPESSGGKLLALGLVPLLSHEKRPAVRAMRVQSAADPPAPLAATRSRT